MAHKFEVGIGNIENSAYHQHLRQALSTKHTG